MDYEIYAKQVLYEKHWSKGVLVLIHMKYFFINCSVLTPSDNIVMNMKQIVKAPLINVHVY